jgi:hypothetical protein
MTSTPLPPSLESLLRSDPAGLLRAVEVERCRRDPAHVMHIATGHIPDEWQARLLRSTSERMLVNCHRQAGKSTATAALGVHTALARPDSLVLIISAAHRQANELFRKVVAAYEALGKPVPAVEDNAVTLALSNGSRIVSLPANAATIRGYSAPRLIIVDEAAWVPDEVHTALAPMLAISRGRLVELSTPYGKRGHFHAAWAAESGWEKVEFPATANPRMDAGWLAAQRATLGERWYKQEFLCSFEETVDQIFSQDSIDNAFDSEEAPLF